MGVVYLCAVYAFGVDEGEGKSEEEGSSYWERVKEAYEEAKSDKEGITEGTKRLIKKDIDRIGDWQYKVIILNAGEASNEIENQLNELGEERWECFFVDAAEGKRMFYFKKPKISYLQKISKADVVKLLGN